MCSKQRTSFTSFSLGGSWIPPHFRESLHSLFRDCLTFVHNCHLKKESVLGPLVNFVHQLYGRTLIGCQIQCFKENYNFKIMNLLNHSSSFLTHTFLDSPDFVLLHPGIVQPSPCLFARCEWGVSLCVQSLPQTSKSSPGLIIVDGFQYWDLGGEGGGREEGRGATTH